jgi:hypothetical protein
MIQVFSNEEPLELQQEVLQLSLDSQHFEVLIQK